MKLWLMMVLGRELELSMEINVGWKVVKRFDLNNYWVYKFDIKNLKILIKINKYFLFGKYRYAIRWLIVKLLIKTDIDPNKMSYGIDLFEANNEKYHIKLIKIF